MAAGNNATSGPSTPAKGAAPPEANASAPASSKSVDPPHPHVQKLVDGLSSYRPTDVWECLPAAYQDDLLKLVRAAGEMDEELHLKLFEVLKKAAGLDATRIGILRESLRSRVSGKDSLEAKLAGQLDNLSELVDAVANSSLSSRDWLRDPKLEDLVRGDGAKIMAGGMRLSAALGGGSTAPMRGLTVKPMVGLDNIVELTDGNQTARWECVKLDDKWLPRNLTDRWPALMASGHAVLKPFGADALKDNPERKAALMALLDDVGQSLTKIDLAENASDLDGDWPAIADTFLRLVGRPPPPPGRVLKWSYGGDLPGVQNIARSLRQPRADIIKSLGEPDQVVAPNQPANTPQRPEFYMVYRGLELFDARPGRNNARLEAVAFGIINGVVVDIQVQ